MIDRRKPSRWLALLGLPVLVYAEIFLRRNLEHADRHLYSFFVYFYPAAEKTIFHDHFPWWKMLLPIRELTGAWSFTVIATHFLELMVGVPDTWYLLNVLLVVVSFATGWFAFESMAFAYTFAICMGFGTHFVHAYAVSGGMGSPLIACCFEVLLLCAYRFVVAGRRAGWWGAAFAASAVMTALMYEGWLDLAVFMCAAAALLGLIAWHRGARTETRRLAVVGGSIAALVVIYVIIKTRLGYAQTTGSESDVVFNYRQWAPLVEDVASNIVTHLYMAVTNFLPPMLTSSTALYDIGADDLVALQGGYHARFAYLVPMHYLFLWRYVAGALALGLAFLLVRLVVRAWQRPSQDGVTVILGVLMMWLAGSTHALIKIRPMKVAPIMGYHVLVGVIGAAILISYGVMVIWRDWRSAFWRVTATAFVWGVVFYGALARPLMLSHLAAQVGLGRDIYPDPMAALLELFGQARRPPGGLAPYALMKRPASMRDEATAPPLMSDLPPLPNAAPDLARWAKGIGVAVTKTSGGYAVAGNEIGGYQLTSPAIPVPPRHRLMVRAGGTIDGGRICLWILDKRQAWLLAPQPGVAELAADTGANDAIALVFSTCTPSGDVVAPRFQVTSISYAVLINPDDAVH